MVSFPEDVEIRGGSLIVKERGELAPPHGSQIRLRIRPEDDTVAIFDADGKQALRFNSSFALLEVGGKEDNGQGNGREGDIHVYDGQGTIRIRMGGDEGIRLHDTSGNERIRIDGRSGRIRILDTAGDDRVRIDGENSEIRVHSNFGNVRIRVDSNEDDIRFFDSNLAVEFEIEDSSSPLDVGMVMVPAGGDGGPELKLTPCRGVNDTRIVGVIINGPQGIVLNHRTSGRRKPIAVAGTVECLVDADPDPILVGDVLTTSNRVGYAKKARRQEPGSILGKALQAVPSGRRRIPILLSLS